METSKDEILQEQEKAEQAKRQRLPITRICATLWENEIDREEVVARYMENGQMTKEEAQAKADKIPQWIIKGEGFKTIGYLSDNKEAKNGDNYRSLVINDVREAFKLQPSQAQVDPLG